MPTIINHLEIPYAKINRRTHSVRRLSRTMIFTRVKESLVVQLHACDRFDEGCGEEILQPEEDIKNIDDKYGFKLRGIKANPR